MSSLSRPCQGGAARGRRPVPGWLPAAWHGVGAGGAGPISQFNYRSPGGGRANEPPAGPATMATRPAAPGPLLPHTPGPAWG